MIFVTRKIGKLITSQKVENHIKYDERGESKECIKVNAASFPPFEDIWGVIVIFVFSEHFLLFFVSNIVIIIKRYVDLYHTYKGL